MIQTFVVTFESVGSGRESDCSSFERASVDRILRRAERAIPMLKLILMSASKTCQLKGPE